MLCLVDEIAALWAFLILPYGPVTSIELRNITRSGSWVIRSTHVLPASLVVCMIYGLRRPSPLRCRTSLPADGCCKLEEYLKDVGMNYD